MAAVPTIRAKNKKQMENSNKRGPGEPRQKKSVTEIYSSPSTKVVEALEPLVEESKETQITLQEKDLVREFLSLENPVIDENAQLFFETLGIQYLTSEIYDTTDIQFPVDFVDAKEMEERVLSGGKVVSVLTNPLNLEFTGKHKIEILQEILKVYSIHSKVSTTAFKIIYMYIIQKWEDASKWVLEDLNWIWILLNYVNDSNTMDCIMVTIFRYCDEGREFRQDRFMKFVELEWMDELFKKLNQGKQQVVELVRRVVKESVSTPDGHMLYMNLIIGENPLKEFVLKVSKGQEVGFEVLHEIITCTPSLNGLGYAGFTPIYEPRNAVIQYLLPNLKEFYQNHYENTTSNTKKLYVLEILVVILDTLGISQNVDDLYDILLLKQITSDFFYRYHNNSIFQSRYYKFMCLVLDNVSGSKLPEILEACNMIKDLISQYSLQKEQRIYSALDSKATVSINELNISQTLKEKEIESLIKQETGWDSVSKTIEDEIERQKAPIYPNPPPKLVASKIEDMIPILPNTH